MLRPSATAAFSQFRCCQCGHGKCCARHTQRPDWVPIAMKLPAVPSCRHTRHRTGIHPRPAGIPTDLLGIETLSVDLTTRVSPLLEPFLPEDRARNSSPVCFCPGGTHLKAVHWLLSSPDHGVWRVLPQKIGLGQGSRCPLSAAVSAGAGFPIVWGPC